MARAKGKAANEYRQKFWLWRMFGFRGDPPVPFDKKGNVLRSKPEAPMTWRFDRKCGTWACFWERGGVEL